MSATRHWPAANLSIAAQQKSAWASWSGLMATSASVGFAIRWKIRAQSSAVKDFGMPGYHAVRALTLVWLFSCSSNPTAPPATADHKLTAEAPETQTGPSLGIEDLVSIDAIGIVRQPPDQFLVLLEARKLVQTLKGSLPECWTKLEKQLVAGYMISLPVGAYFIVEGNLAPAAVEACIASELSETFESSKAGELVMFQSLGGTFFAGWRGRYLVLGSRKKVEDALRSPATEVVARWRELIQPLAKAPLWMLRTDASLADVIGTATTSYEFVIDRFEGPPRSYLAGRFTIRYASSADAETGARWIATWIKRGEFPRQIKAPPEALEFMRQIVTALQRMKLARKGTTVELAFDSEMLEGLDLWNMFMAAGASLK
jgi:hypothetical protein